MKKDFEIVKDFYLKYMYSAFVFIIPLIKISIKLISFLIENPTILRSILQHFFFYNDLPSRIFRFY